MIYLDYAANSPVDSEVLEVFCDTTKKYIANPNSSHQLGREAKALIDETSTKILQLLDFDKGQVIYTSGATEANNLAVKGIASKYKNRGKHIITCELDHSSVLAPIKVLQEQDFEVDMVRLQDNGQVDLEHLKSLLREDTILVSIGYVDGEMGIVQPINEIGELIKSFANCHFHCDATQMVGRKQVDLSGVDLVSFAPHKFNGLNGVGILIKRENTRLEPMIHGGSSTTIYRSGTPVTAFATSTLCALEKSLKHASDNWNYVQDIHNRLREQLSVYQQVEINSTIASIPHILNISIVGTKSTSFAQALEDEKVYVTTKSACCPVHTMSRAVYAVTKDKKRAGSTIRMSLSHLITKEEIEEFLVRFNRCMDKL